MTLRRYKRIYCIVRNKTQSSKRHQWYQFSGILQEVVYVHTRNYFTRNYFCMTFSSSFYLTKPPCILPFQLKMCLRHWPCQYIEFPHFFFTITQYSIVWMYHNLLNQAASNFYFSFFPFSQWFSEYFTCVWGYLICNLLI